MLIVQLLRRLRQLTASSWLALIVLSIAATWVRPAAAAGFEQAVAGLASEDRDQLGAAIVELGASGEPRALVVLKALDAGQIKLDEKGAVFIQDGGALVDAKTGSPAQPSGATRTPPLNNRVRKNLTLALARSELESPNAEVRLNAATTLSKDASTDLVPAMRAALAKENDADVADLLKLSIAGVDLASEDAKLQLDALRMVGDVSAVGLLPAVRRLAEEGGPAKSPEVKTLAGAVEAALERKVLWVSTLANLFYGLSLGSVLLLAALGLAITFGLMRVINMAHGEMLMLGAYSTFVVQNIVKQVAPSWFGAYLVLALPTAFVVCAVVGVLLERTVIRFLYGRPLETLLATWGISLGLIQTVRLLFGAQNVAVENPSWLSGGWELLPTVVLPYSRIVVIVFSMVVVGFVWMLLQKTRLGLYVRAVTQNREMAGNVGIATRRIDMWTFALGSGVAGLGGVALSQLGNVGPELGQSYIVDCFMVVVLGGVGNLAGTVAGAVGLGVANKFLEPLTGAVLGKIMLLVILILFIQWRPQGMFAPKGRAAAEL
ncbi:MAG TPA: urea ABC transporter permease subunit UrtB [Polyangiaceae bacterium]|nr:urea ABC transporter permease subunit UrtB [Polyangiaceae bacterium]